MKIQERLTPVYIRWAWGLGIAGLVVVVIFFLGNIVLYLVVALMMTLIGRPIFDLLERLHFRGRQLPSSLAALGALLVFYLAGAVVVLLFVPLIISEAEMLQKIKATTVVNQLRAPFDEYNAFLRKYHIQIDIYATVEKYLTRYLQRLYNGFSAGDAFGIVSGISDFLILIFSTSFIAYFFLEKRTLLPTFIRSLTPLAYKESTVRIMMNAKHLLRRYFIGLIIQESLVCTLYGVGFLILGLENAFILALIAGTLNVIPYIGQLIGIGIAMVIAVSMQLHLGAAANAGATVVYMSLVFVVVQLMDSFLFQPLIFSNSVKAHPLEIFFVVLIGGNLWGIVGMVIAIPIYTVLRVVVKELFTHHEFFKRMTGHL